MFPSSPKMGSIHPYLIQACYAWIVDNQCRPFIRVDATYPGVQVPSFAVKDGLIVLNISPQSVASFQMNQDSFRFHARFSGKSLALVVPMAAILAIYAEETQVGLQFPPSAPPPPSPVPPPPAASPKPSRGHLRVIK